MQLKKLNLYNFRNYRELKIAFSDGVHILYGPNGAGKTNILEAVFYLALTKSFRTNLDRHLIYNKEKMFRIKGDFITDQGQVLQCLVSYSLTEGKRLVVNGQKIAKFSDFIGELPVVMLCPADLQLSQGSPLQRRRFIDILLSQSSNLYLYHLIEYRRTLKQRNALLQQASPDEALLESYEESLIKHGCEIIRRRKATVLELNEVVKTHYQELSNTPDKVKIIYQSDVLGNRNDTELEERYRQKFSEKRKSEMEAGVTQIGPHRDDLLFLINGKPLKNYASQGEHKSFVIALKLAEYQYLQRQKYRAPILLFDDIFGELDAVRIRKMLNQLGNLGQVFVTTTSRNFFDKVQDFAAPTSYYFVNQGTIEYQKA